MKFLVPIYSCLQKPWLGGYCPQIPVLSVLCPQLNLLTPPQTKFLGTPLLCNMALNPKDRPVPSQILFIFLPEYGTLSEWLLSLWLFNIPPCKYWGSCSTVPKDFIILEHDTASLRYQILTFLGTVLPSSSNVEISKKNYLSSWALMFWTNGLIFTIFG